MSTNVVSSSIAFAVPANTTLALVRPADVEEGDLLAFAWLIMNDASNDATNFLTTLALPTGWSHAGYSATAGQRIIWTFKYVGDLDTEPASYTFTYLASRVMTGMMIAIRGAARTFASITFAHNPPSWTHPDPTKFAAGYYAPLLSEGAVDFATSATLDTVNSTFPKTLAVNTRVIYAAMQIDTVGNAPLLDDPSPLPTIHQKARPGAGTGADSMAVMLFDVEYPAVVSPPTQINIVSNLSRPWVVASIAVEPLDPDTASLDNYKSKLIRSLLPPETWDTDFDGPLGGLLSVIGTSDNDIGGLFGPDDFLPNGDE